MSDAPPPGTACSHVEHRVAFYETDAMGVVHHANYLRFFELGRVRWLDEHDRPYVEYVDAGLHFAVTHAELDYRRGARFDDRLRVLTWLSWVAGASLGMAYRIERGDEIIVVGRTEHAALNDQGRVRRIPREDRRRLAALAVGEADELG
ncbi:MAG: acyl-CoA thioesterase [Deltaproteobacteria bacterium]|nr:acyl-CoA thioesterase [Deltaproteobacteria bacterium]